MEQTNGQTARHPLAAWRVERGMTQRDLAALLGISQQAVGRYESGTRTPRARMISLIETITEGVVSLRHFTEDASGIDDPRSDPAAI